MQYSHSNGLAGLDATKPFCSDRRGGFTLIELMVVVGLILMISGFAIVGFRGTEARRMDAALRIVQGQVNYARQFAITQRTETALVIPISGAGNEHDMRAFFVASGSGNTMTNAITGWITLPQGVYFDRDPSLQDNVLVGSPGSISMPGGNFINPAAEVRILRFNLRGELHGMSTDQRIYLAEGVLDGTTFTRFNDDPNLADLVLVRRLTGLPEIHRLN